MGLHRGVTSGGMAIVTYAQASIAVTILAKSSPRTLHGIVSLELSCEGLHTGWTLSRGWRDWQPGDRTQIHPQKVHTPSRKMCFAKLILIRLPNGCQNGGYFGNRNGI
jgi:hypothetical protein